MKKIKILTDGLIGDSICCIPTINAFSKIFDEVIWSIEENHKFLISNEYKNLFKIPDNIEVIQGRIYPDIILKAINVFNNRYLGYNFDTLFYLYACERFSVLKTVEPTYFKFKNGKSFVNYNDIIVSPFSRSMEPGSENFNFDLISNKGFLKEKWIEFFQTFSNENFVIIGGPNDPKPFDLPNIKYKYGESFVDVKESIKECKLFISVDNGMGHIARILRKQPHITFAITDIFKTLTCNPLAHFFVRNEKRDNIIDLINITNQVLSNLS